MVRSIEIPFLLLVKHGETMMNSTPVRPRSPSSRSEPPGACRERSEVPSAGPTWHRSADAGALAQHEVTQPARTGARQRKGLGCRDGWCLLDGNDGGMMIMEVI